MARAGLLHDTGDAGWRAWLDAAGEPGTVVGPGPVFEDFNLLRAAALAGQGVALCPLAITCGELKRQISLAPGKFQRCQFTRRADRGD